MFSILADGVINYGIGTFAFVNLVKLQSVFYSMEAASIGVIGGADGPTAVFISGDRMSLLLFMNVVLFAFLMMLYKPIKWFVER